MVLPPHTPSWIRVHLVALRALLALTIVVGIAYPLAITALAQLPGLRDKADASLVRVDGAVVGSRLIGQEFTDTEGNPLPEYFQSRPSASDYDPTASGASNLGPEDVVDVLDDPATRRTDESSASLLTQVCTRSLQVGSFNGVSGARPYCTTSGVGAVLAVFYAGPGYTGAITKVVSVNEACPAKPFLFTYQGIRVQCDQYGDDIAGGKQVPVRGDAPRDPAVPADAVTASGSGLDPDISPAYARLQVNRVASARGLEPSTVLALVDDHVSGRTLGFLGEPHVNVLELNVALDAMARRQ